MNIDTILLDLDGTLWDSSAGVAFAWQTVIDRYPGLRKTITKKEIAACMGFNTIEIGKMILPNTPKKLREKLMQECFEEEHQYLLTNGGILYPGVKDTLAYLASKYKIAIVSNCETGYIECFLVAHNLMTYFNDYECFGKTKKEKGENLLLVMQRLKSKNAIFVGDMLKDALAAKYAKIPFVFASYGFSKYSQQPYEWDYSINHFTELVTLIEK